MKILSSDQIKKVDQYCIDSESISRIELMEKSAKSCFNWIIQHLTKNNTPFIILSGVGNNGGDGLALARILYIHGFQVSVYILNVSNHYSDEFLINKNKALKYGIKLENIYQGDVFPILNRKSYLIDSIFGIGFNRTIGNFWKKFIHFINEKKFRSIISIDVPSGIFIEKQNHTYDDIIQSNYTLTFEVPKLPFFLPSYDKYVGKWFILNIGWKNHYIKKMYTKNFYIDEYYIKKIKKKREKFSHKGNYGYGVLIGGSYGMIGSIILSGKASIRSGIGKLILYTPHCGYSIIQNQIPEAIIQTDKNKNYISNIVSLPNNINSIGIGMGMGTNYHTKYALESFLMKCNKNIPIVIDADAINIIAKHLNLLNYLPHESIITPHPKEFSRIFGIWKNDYQKLQMLTNISKKYNIFIILKGAHTIISTPDKELYFNSTGNPGMATAGSGDVLSGIIVSLLSQGYSPKNSCIISVYLHGLSGDIAKNQFNEEFITSTDIIHYLSKAFQKI
ncbi:NAD(P)H-hydrate dehydratase [Blattabacterium cuenoti]|uniref:NAD(P)H-hydrate dehydratase n=1 Tax=Blattabacterium cuenoti TaxID=1653831 RepID=UPI00163BF7F0|nr:NAD(P)H-hydrate dehydratase [Blattabacterium cuenoti]